MSTSITHKYFFIVNETNMEPYVNLIVFVTFTIVIVVSGALAMKYGKSSNSNNSSNSSNSSNSGKKEGFLLTSQNAFIDGTTGAMKGPGIMTDGMTRRSLQDMWGEVEQTGFTSDKTISLGVGPGNGFDDPYKNHLDIASITSQNTEGNYQSNENLDAVSRKIASNQSNSANNLYTRAGSKPTKMIIEPNGIRGVIDAKYLPDRDKNYQIATVNCAVPVQGYDVNIERIGEYLIDTHFSQISKNGKHKRIPTAAGAIGGGARMNNQSDLDYNNGDEDAGINNDALNQILEVSQNKLIFKDGNKKIGVQLETSGKSQQLAAHNTYLKGNHQ